MPQLTPVTLAAFALGVAAVAVGSLLLSAEAQSTVVGAGSFLLGLIFRLPGTPAAK